jgi:outer membrane protein assembly factor BamB/adenine/guanine phosphoribosyltransferase-like PRPP-binding protein
MNSFNPAKRKFLFDLISQKAFLTGDDQPLISPSGGKQEWLLDMRRIFVDAGALDAISDLFWDYYKSKGPIQIAGMEVAAVPLVTALLMKARTKGIMTNGLLIRKERKTTGTGQSIEGVPNNDPVVLVDDLINSGASLEKARMVIDQAGLVAGDVFVVVDYESTEGFNWRRRTRLNVTSIFNLSEFGRKIIPPQGYSATDYTIIWRYYAAGAFAFNTVPKSTPLLVGDKIYMGLEKGALVCVDAQTGEAVWEYPVPVTHTKGVWSSPAHHQGRLYFGAYNGNVYCLDAATGAEIWKNPACEWVGSSPLIVPEHNRLYIGLEYQRPRAMGSNAAFNLDTGARVWETPQKKYQHGSAAYYAPLDAVVFGNADHNVTAYEAETGKIIWQCDTERSHKYPPAVDLERGRIISTSFDGNIYVIDGQTGKRLAAFQTEDICYTTPLVHGGKIYAGSGDRHMYIIDADTLSLIEKIDTGARVYSSPRLIDGRIVFGNNGGRIFELDPVSNEIIGVSQLPDAVPNAVIGSPDGTMMYAATHMNEIYAIKRR